MWSSAKREAGEPYCEDLGTGGVPQPLTGAAGDGGLPAAAVGAGGALGGTWLAGRLFPLGLAG